jgi:hypothetical protein
MHPNNVTLNLVQNLKLSANNPSEHKKRNWNTFDTKTCSLFVVNPFLGFLYARAVPSASRFSVVSWCTVSILEA